MSADPALRDRARGCLLGLAVGDALGTTVEFQPPNTFPPVTGIVVGGPFGLPAGAWTDDTSMALCLADSLLAVGGFDPVDQLARYVRWYRRGERSATGECFDIGNATRAGLERHERTGEPYPGDAFPDAAGNGTLMRLAPVPMACVGDLDRAADWGARSARTTHGAPQAVDATGWYAVLVARALAGAPREELLGPGPVAKGGAWTPGADRGGWRHEAEGVRWSAGGEHGRWSAEAERGRWGGGVSPGVGGDQGGVDDGGDAAGRGTEEATTTPSGDVRPGTDPADLAALHPEVREVVAGSFARRRPPEIRGAGYVVRSLEAALWAVWSTTSFRDAVLAAVNLGDDADTTGAIAGQLAGALYGAAAIPREWREVVLLGDEIAGLADGLLALSPAVAEARVAGGSQDAAAIGRAVGATSVDDRAERPRRHLPDDPRRPDAPPNESWWVEEGRLLAGPYPGHAEKARAAEKLERFLDAGVTVFVDLTEHGEHASSGPLHPYEPLLRRIAKRRSREAAAAGREAPRIGYVRLPVPDVGVAPDWQMRATLTVIEEALAADELVYVHCWGGVGRTGTAVAARLIAAGCPAERAIREMNALRRPAPRAGMPSPQGPEQPELLRRWRPLSSDLTRPDEIPDADGPYEAIAAFGNELDGYRRLGGPGGGPGDPHVVGPMTRCRAAFGESGRIPADLAVDELRAILFLHLRGQRFGSDEEDWSSGRDPERETPRRFQRALVRRIGELLREREA